MYIQRALEPTVLSISRTFPVLLVTGPRQVGKTTLLKRLAEPGRSYVTLDDPLLRELAVNDPALFLDRFKPPLLIDEIRYAPTLPAAAGLLLPRQGKDRDRSGHRGGRNLVRDRDKEKLQPGKGCGSILQSLGTR